MPRSDQSVFFSIYMCLYVYICICLCVTYRVVLCRTVSYCVVLCRTVSYRVVLCRTVSYCVVLCRTVSYCVVLCRTVSYGVGAVRHLVRHCTTRRTSPTRRAPTPCTTLYDASYAPDASGPDTLYDAPTRRTVHFRQHSGGNGPHSLSTDGGETQFWWVRSGPCGWGGGGGVCPAADDCSYCPRGVHPPASADRLHVQSFPGRQVLEGGCGGVPKCGHKGIRTERAEGDIPRVAVEGPRGRAFSGTLHRTQGTDLCLSLCTLPPKPQRGPRCSTSSRTQTRRGCCRYGRPSRTVVRALWCKWEAGRNLSEQRRCEDDEETVPLGVVVDQCCREGPRIPPRAHTGALGAAAPPPGARTQEMPVKYLVNSPNWTTPAFGRSPSLCSNRDH